MALATARVKLSENVPTVRSTSKTEETWDGGVEEQQSNRAEQKISGVTEAAEQRYCGAAAGREMGHFGGHQVGLRTYCNALGQTTWDNQEIGLTRDYGRLGIHSGGHQIGHGQGRTFCNALGQTIKCPNIWKKGNFDQSPNFLLPGKATGVQLLLNISNL